MRRAACHAPESAENKSPISRTERSYGEGGASGGEGVRREGKSGEFLHGCTDCSNDDDDDDSWYRQTRLTKLPPVRSLFSSLPHVPSLALTPAPFTLFFPFFLFLHARTLRARGRDADRREWNTFARTMGEFFAGNKGEPAAITC